MRSGRFFASVTIVFSLTVLALYSCGTLQEITIRDEVLNDPGVSPYTKRLIEEKKIVVGMTKREVRASWGNPITWSPCTRRHVYGSDVYESWDYSSGCRGTIVRFVNGRCEGWSD